MAGLTAALRTEPKGRMRRWKSGYHELLVVIGNRKGVPPDNLIAAKAVCEELSRLGDILEEIRDRMAPAP